MITLLLLSVIIGLFITGITGYTVLGVLAAGVVFVCGLPMAVIFGCVHGEVKYAQDRADLRQIEADIEAAELAGERELLEDDRMDRLVNAIKDVEPSFNDNRQVHIHNKVITFPFGERISGSAAKE
jgi:hypothetical protein